MMVVGAVRLTSILLTKSNVMDYKEVFQLAQEKGYKLFFDWSEALESNPDHDEVYELNPQLTIAELTLIQNWLRDEKSISVTVVDSYVTQDYKATVKALYAMDSRYQFCDLFSSYEQALLEGIHEALKLLP